MMNSKKTGLYIHIPFCKSICPYCDFHKMVASKSLQDEYIKALLKEMKLKNLCNYSFDSLYIGGGTPSSLSIDNLELLLSNIADYIDFSNVLEFSFEVNVLDITPQLLEILSKYGVNRLSIGIQTINENLQKKINRVYSKEEILSRIEIVKKFFNNYSVDLMYALPDETMDDLKEDLDFITSLNPPHISTYCLIKEPRTIFEYQNIQELDDNIQEQMYFYIHNYLENKNLFRYETSNFSIKGYESIHNNHYWNLYDYYCLGSGASAFYNNTHFKTTTKIKDYINSLSNNELPKIDYEMLSNDELIDEFISMSLRKKKGLSFKNFNTIFNIPFDSLYKYEDLLNKGLLVIDNDNLFIPLEYTFVQDYVIVELLNRRL